MRFPSGSITAALLEVIGRSPGISISDLHDKLVREYDATIALSNLYRPIRNLLKEKVLFKEGKGYILSTEWIDELADYASLLQTAQDAQLAFPLDRYETRQWVVNTDKEREKLWWTIQSRMIETADERAYDTYRSHSFWRPAVLADKRWSSLPQDFRTYAVYGNDTFLDRYGIGISNLLGGSSVIAPDAPYPKEGYVLFVCGEYICDWSYHPTIAQGFAEIFTRTQSIHEFSVEELRALYTKEAPFSLNLRRDPEEADKHRTIIRVYCTTHSSSETLLTDISDHPTKPPISATPTHTPTSTSKVPTT